MVDAGLRRGLIAAALGVALACAMPAEARAARKHVDHHPKAAKIEPVKGRFSSNGALIDEIHCVPNGRGKSPVVMLLHGCAPKDFGADEFNRMCVGLAERGYYAMFIEYYGAAGAPNCRDLAMMPAVSLAPETPIPDDTWMREIVSARDSLARNPRADTSRVGVIGFSFGATLAVITASLKPNVIGAIVDYYGFSNERVEEAVTHASNFPPTLILQGDSDYRAHATDSIHLHNVIARHQPASEIHIYPGIDHAFNFHDAFGYDAPTSKDAWSRTLSFFDLNLK
jgi:dienelactone hydrolase